MKICLITSECVPYVKTGGLADVCGSLPPALSNFGAEIKVFLPLYGIINREKFTIKPVSGIKQVSLKLGEKEFEFSVYNCKHTDGKTEVYFIECAGLYDRDSIYTQDSDEDERFILFQYAVFLTLQNLQWAPDVFHCNDWQSGLIPALLKLKFNRDKLFTSAATVLSIHNIGYQGIFSKESIFKANFPESSFVLGGPFEYNGNTNFLKAGIWYADLITTVSKTYAEEIQTSEYGSGLDGVLKSRSDNIAGILNGIDNNLWNPVTDNLISENYGIDNIRLKEKNKVELLELSGLRYSEHIPVYGIVSRFAWQKGFELFFDTIDEILDNNIQLIVLGSGEEHYEDFFLKVSLQYSDKVYVRFGFDNRFAHLITAGSDFFVMPSRYEPCGLNQMYSLNYGTIPIVRKTGGLADTVIDFGNNESGNGIVFDDFLPEQLLVSMKRAEELFIDKPLFDKVRRSGMSADFSWERSALQYMNIYNKVKKPVSGT